MAKGLSEMTYAEMTRNTSEPLKRMVHKTRLGAAARLISLNPKQKVLDYGCGDGGFFDELVKYVPASNLFGYEPYILGEGDFTGIATYEDAGELVKAHPGEFDVVFCLEVCEHLNQQALTTLFDNIRACSKFEAVFVFGVPLETGIPGFTKNIYRTLKGNRQNATLGRALKSLINAYIPRAHDRNGWIGSHIGFDGRYFREQLAYGGFDVVGTRCLPWPVLGKALNNEVYFICKRNEAYGR